MGEKSVWVLLFLKPKIPEVVLENSVAGLINSGGW